MGAPSGELRVRPPWKYASYNIMVGYNQPLERLPAAVCRPVQRIDHSWRSSTPGRNDWVWNDLGAKQKGYCLAVRHVLE